VNPSPKVKGGTKTMRNPSSRIIAVAVAAIAVATLSGASVQAGQRAREEANKKLVRDFYTALEDTQAKGEMKAKGRALIEKYMAPDYIQHRPGQQSGREAMIRNTEGAPAMPASISTHPKLVAILGDGDLVVQVTDRGVPDPVTGVSKPALIWNMFRIKNGKLAEHWDALPEGMAGPPPSPGMAGPPPGAPPPGR
jgi:predicted SnoaL-like aldol condensation-catalyzing enzyme